MIAERYEATAAAPACAPATDAFSGSRAPAIAPATAPTRKHATKYRTNHHTTPKLMRLTMSAPWMPKDQDSRAQGPTEIRVKKSNTVTEADSAEKPKASVLRFITLGAADK